MPALDPIEAAAFAVDSADRARQRALRYLNLFRLILGGLFLVAGEELGLGSESPRLYLAAVVGYLAAVLTLGFPDAVRRLGFARVVILLAIADIVALAAIMWVSGGYRSGMPVLMMVMLAGAGLIGEGRMVMFSSALATLAVLAENASRLVGGGKSVEFLQVGIFCAGFFGIAAIARLLALRAQANAALAAERGVALAKQQAVSAHILRDMQDGVIVVGRAWPRSPRQRAGVGDARPVACRRARHSTVSRLPTSTPVWRTCSSQAVGRGGTSDAGGRGWPPAALPACAGRRRGARPRATPCCISPTTRRSRASCSRSSSPRSAASPRAWRRDP